MLYALLAAATITLLAFLGVLATTKNGKVEGAHRIWIPFSAGIFLGLAFFELIPETIEAAGKTGGLIIVGGFLFFFLLSHLLRNDHICEHGKYKEHYSSTSLLIGDGIHNAIDGVLLVSAFTIDSAMGFAVAFAITLHEVPQEIAKYATLRAAGKSHKRALSFVLLTAATLMSGVIIGQLFIDIYDALWIASGIVAGNLLYITSSDLLPELQGDNHRTHFGTVFVSLLAGLALIYTTTLLPHFHLHTEVSKDEHKDTVHNTQSVH